ncbi:hypothetical protein DL93DRAFT_971521 [Clavulina sp. PMI_390]|nr:hypothetical protein DL93DRAFT_971521 [Clavulina sp. PMI_390]
MPCFGFTVRSYPSLSPVAEMTHGRFIPFIAYRSEPVVCPLCLPLVSWFFLGLPTVLSAPYFGFGGLLDRIVLLILEPLIISGLLFCNIYGVFWTMNVLRLSPPFLQRRTELGVVRRTTRSLWFAVGDIVWAVGGRHISGASAKFTLGRLSNQDGSSSANRR